MQDAFDAEYYTFKLVKSRNVVQIILEKDEAYLMTLLDILGNPGHGKRVMVTLLRDVEERTDIVFNEGEDS